MFGGSEASIAAGEILALIKDLKRRYRDSPEAIKALEEVETKATDIRRLGDAGYY